MRSILAWALLCAASMQASAQYSNGYFVDGNELTTWCEPRNVAGPSNTLCLGYVAGVSDAANSSRQFTGQDSNTNCTPPGVTIVQEADVVVNYINRNPDKRDLAAAARNRRGVVFTSNGSTERSLPSALIVVSSLIIGPPKERGPKTAKPPARGSKPAALPFSPQMPTSGKASLGLSELEVKTREKPGKSPQFDRRKYTSGHVRFQHFFGQ
jgi:hypothetical protein